MLFWTFLTFVYKAPSQREKKEERVNMIQQAIILVAPESLLCLKQIGGLSLLKRNILTAYKAGIDEVMVLASHDQLQVIQQACAEFMDTQSLKVFSHTKSQELFANLKAVRAHLQERFFIMHAEEIYSVSHLNQLKNNLLSRNTLIIGLRNQDNLTKPLQSLIERSFQLVSKNKNDMHLSAVHLSILDSEKLDTNSIQVIPVILNKGFWASLSDSQEIPSIRKAFFSSLRKPTDGWIRRHLNRRISLSLSRVLCHMPFSANHITGMGTLLGILSGFLVASGTFWQVFFGGLLFQLSSILDGVDGEISRLKLTNSAKGEWFDTICDNITYLAFFTGVVAGLYNQGYELLYLETGLLVFGLIFFLALMFYYLLRYTKSGSLTAIQSRLMKADDLKSSGWIIYGISKLKFMMKRDFFSFLFMSLAMIHKLHWILHLVVIGTNLSWMVLLFLRNDIIKVKPSEATS